MSNNKPGLAFTTWRGFALMCVFFLPVACSTPSQRYADQFVHWDALSDAQNAAGFQCDGPTALIEGRKGYSPDDYRCLRAVSSPPVLLLKFGEVVLCRDSVRAAETIEGGLSVHLTKLGADQVARETARNVGKPLGIWLDERLLQSPIVREPLESQTLQISVQSAADALEMQKATESTCPAK